MSHADFENRLTRSLHPVSTGETGLENTILLARREAVRKGQRRRIPFLWFLTKQVCYIGWKLWGVQGLMLLLFDRMLIQLYGERFWDSPVSVARLLFCVSTLVAMMALPLLHRSRTYRMQEIESAAYFSSVRLLMAKLAVIGMGDMLLLGGMFLTTMVRTSMAASSLTLCLLLPFLMMSAAYLYMIGHCSGKGFFQGSICLGAAMLLLAVGVPGRWLSLLQPGMTLGTGCFCLGLLAFSAGQLRYLLYHSSYTELQVS